MYLLKLALRPWRIALLSQIFAGVAVGLLLCIAGLLFWMERGLKPVIARLESEQVITAYISPELPEGDEVKVSDVIKTAVGARALEVGMDPARIDIKSVSAPEFVEQLRAHYPDLTKELESFGSEMNQIVPRYISISGSLPDQALEDVKAVSGVEAAESSKDRHEHIVGAFRALRWVARLLIAGLAVALLTGLIHLSKMNAYLHQDALSLMRLWGADGFKLRLPGAISALTVGLAGGLTAALAWAGGSAWLAHQMFALSPMLQGMPDPSVATAAVLLLTGAFIGMASGLIGHNEGRG